MELLTPTPQPNRLAFTGEGFKLLVIMLVNWVFTVFTLGLYYPWARVNTLKFLYGNIVLNDVPFIFHGTGKELFKGFLKFFALLIVLYGGYAYAVFSKDTGLILIFGLLFFAFIVLIIPFALHGAFRYRLARTSWSGIHLGYRGNRKHLFFDFITSAGLTLITFGLYYSWMVNGLRTYIIGNSRFGSIKFSYTGSGGDLFIIHLKGYFLSMFTLGLYYFWYRKEYLNYLIDNIYLEKNGQQYPLKGHILGGSFFALSIINLFLTVFTLGIAIPWVTVRTMNFMIENIELPAEINFEQIEQTEDDYADATGEDVLDYLDIGLI
jgi:uncharacterized membrane protein YjgN (DUF898 family)